jgi:hypothetical protein
MRDLSDLEALAIGTVAADVLRHAHAFDIIGVFERSWVLLTGQGIVAVCAQEVGRGPIAVTVPDLPSPWRDRVRVGDKGRIEAQRLVLDAGFGVSLARAAAWSPPPFPGWPSPHLAANLTAFKPLAALACPLDGLAPLVFSPERKHTRTGAAAHTTLTAFRQALPASIGAASWTPEALTAATLLVGLGPGLTPSGDDVLGGVMLALSVRGAEGLRDALWEALVPELDDLTVPISAMHLSCAADGLASEHLHGALSLLLLPDADPRAIATRLDAIGATSGWDVCAGFVLGLTA